MLKSVKSFSNFSILNLRIELTFTDHTNKYFSLFHCFYIIKSITLKLQISNLRDKVSYQPKSEQLLLEMRLK
jgi:hypothetical protein